MDRDCLIQVDMDDLWVIKQMFGRNKVDYFEDEQCYCSGANIILNIFEEFGIKATFFISTIDLKSKKKREVIRRIHESGHEIANHGFRHYYLGELTREQKYQEIDISHNMIVEFSGERVFGFRAPGYSIDSYVIERLLHLDYKYDSSVFPSIVVPMLSLYNGKLSFNHFRHFLSSSKPYHIHSNPFKKSIQQNGLIELPISTFPFLRIPLTFSYLLLYREIGLVLLDFVSWRRQFLVYLFHLNDFVDYDFNKLNFFIFKIPLKDRISLVKKVLWKLKRNYNFQTSYTWCRKYLETS